MKTSKETANNLLIHLQHSTNARIRPMMGEYLLYVDDKLVGQINHNELFIKVTKFGDAFAGDLAKESPYDGAKPAFIVPQDNIDNVDWMKQFLSGTIKEL